MPANPSRYRLPPALPGVAGSGLVALRRAVLPAAVNDESAASAAADTDLWQSLRQERVLREQAQQALLACQAQLRLAQCELARVARIATLGAFSASIAHDVKQPLAAIALNAEAGLNWLAQQPPQLDQARDALRLVLQAGTGAIDVIRSLRGMARKSDPEPSCFAVDPAIGEVLSLLHGELHKHGVQLCVELALDQHRLDADRIQFQQVIMNLLLNAVESMSTVHDRPRTLNLRSALADAAGTLRISVEDNGAGIDSKAAGRLYEPWFSTKPDGMGMGLSICRSIVEAHGGRIWSTSRQPHGAAFHISLPPRASAPYITGEH